MAKKTTVTPPKSIRQALTDVKNKKRKAIENSFGLYTRGEPEAIARKQTVEENPKAVARLRAQRRKSKDHPMNTERTTGHPGGVNRKASGGSVKIKSGDTLSQIAKSKGISLKALLAANPSIKNANKIRVGQSIKIPGAEAGKAAKTSNPYKGMSRVQMADMDVKNKSEQRQRTATRSLQTQAKMGSGMTPTSKESKQKIEDRSGRTHFNAVKERVMGNRSKTNAKPKKPRPPIPSNDIAAKKGGMMKKSYKSGGMVRGAGAATKGKRYGRCG